MGLGEVGSRDLGATNVDGHAIPRLRHVDESRTSSVKIPIKRNATHVPLPRSVTPLLEREREKKRLVQLNSRSERIEDSGVEGYKLQDLEHVTFVITAPSYQRSRIDLG